MKFSRHICFFSAHFYNFSNNILIVGIFFFYCQRYHIYSFSEKCWYISEWVLFYFWWCTNDTTSVDVQITWLPSDTLEMWIVLRISFCVFLFLLSRMPIFDIITYGTLPTLATRVHPCGSSLALTVLTRVVTFSKK